MAVKGELAMDSSAAVVQGKPYVVVPPGAANANGKVVIASANTTAAGLVSALGLDAATVARSCNILARSTGAVAGQATQRLTPE